MTRERTDRYLCYSESRYPTEEPNRLEPFIMWGVPSLTIQITGTKQVWVTPPLSPFELTMLIQEKKRSVQGKDC